MKRVALFLCTLVAAFATLAADVPYLSGRVVDNAEILNAETKRNLTARLKAHEQETSNQIAVLTVRSLEGESVESYAEQVFNTWKLGRKGKDNGVLVLVAPAERRMRIEVGYGLEGTLTDVAASRIVRNVMTPRFKEGNFDAGIEQGVAAIIGQLTGAAEAPADAPAEPAPARAEKSDKFFEGPDLSLTERILIGAFIFGIIGLFTVLGVLTPGMGWFLYFFLIPFWAMFPIVVVGTTGALYLFGTYLVVFPIAKLIVSRQPWYEKAKQDIKTKGTAQIGGFTLTSGGGSSGSSRSSGGGFSGGGGRSGGGGASGSW
jgi:uncharacterized protein